MSSGSDLTCRELVDLVSDYLEGTLAAEARWRFEQHLRECAGCDAYLDQLRKLVAGMRRLSEDDLSSDVRERLLHAFRNWKA